MRIVLRVLAAVFVLIAVVLGGGYLWLRGSLPDLDGRIVVSGPSSAIEIVRDRHGIPHIVGTTIEDALFGLGFVHAQDRLWQMEMNRRVGAGRLAEIVGSAGLGPDRFLRTLGVYESAERTFGNLDAATQRGLEAYAAGVNAFLATRSGPLPPEFLILGHTPEPWRPADTLVWVKMMAWDLAGNWSEELLRARLARQLAPQQLSELFPNYPRDGVTVLTRYADLYRALPLDQLAEALPVVDRHNGSNNWVVSSQRSTTGKPLLANDPHLALGVPSLWYFAHLQAPGLDTIGATLPGVPAVVLGRNDRIAWGFTNTGSDVQDLYIERVDPADASRYLTPGGSAPFETRRETIRVKGAEPVELQVRQTRHGPVISDVVGSAATIAGPGHVLAMSWVTLRDDDLTAQAGMQINRAGTWEEFLAAVRSFHSPHQNMVFASVDGTVGFVAPARVPIRRPGHTGNEPVPGWTGEYDWNGFIPFEHLPRIVNPANGVIATANNRIVPEDYPYYLTDDWAAPFRADRIAELLDQRDRHSLEHFRAIQGDVRSGAAAQFLPRLLQAAAQNPDATRRSARSLLESWDYRMTADRAEPLIYAAWYRELTRLVVEDDLGPLFGDFWAQRPLFMASVLLGDASHWCDDRATPRVESCDDLIRAAFERAIADLTNRYGADLTRWRWGEAHGAQSEHRPFHSQSLLARIFDVRVVTGGDAFTVNAANHRITNGADPFRQYHGASLRALYDLADPERSQFVLSTGQSGNVLSSRYRDQAARWSKVDYLPMQTSPANYQDGALGRLTLIPGRP
ncbi:MAG: penicillin acylase family protein [Alphaproteobacteria bacterium]|nr:penicillin acylase family protein [Alphaproteobacteria bacterium]